jgi:pimeloyl-ACP methyl ester carboxylesterase
MSAPLHAAGRVLTSAFGGRFGQGPANLVEPVPVVRAGLHGLLWEGGAGTPLVLLHGLNSNPWAWARVASLLSVDRPVLALAAPGHGGSPPLTGPWTCEAVTAALLSAIDSQGWSRVDLAGHSWGGKLAFFLACSNAARVGRLVLVDPVMPAGLGPLVGAVPSLMRMAFAAERQVFADHEQWQAGRQGVVYLGYGKDDVDGRYWQAGYRQDVAGRYHHALSDADFQAIVDDGLRADLSALLPDLKAPTLLVVPTFTVSFWPGALRPLRKTGRVQVVRLWGDHTVHHSNPLDTADAMRRFLDPLAQAPLEP